jgi:hypothetical protein
MSGMKASRRDFLGAAAPALATVALADPGRAAAQAAGIKPGDLPDLTIKQVKVWVLKAEGGRPGEKFAAVVTQSGIEGNYVLEDRYYHTNWSNLGWLEYAKAALPGKSVLDLLRLRPLYTPRRARRSPLHRR